MRLLITIFTILSFLTTVQGQTAAGYIKEGIALHDKGDFKSAVEKYDQALSLEPENYLAMYEKSLALMMTKQYKDAEKILKVVIKNCKDADTKRLAYVNYGTVMDYQGHAKEALKIYDKGIKEFPGSYSLYFNKAITLISLEQPEKAIENLQLSLQRNPLHASSHNALARLQAGKSRIKAIISLFSFLIIEPEGNRASQNLELLTKLMNQGINKNADNNITISIDASLLDAKKSPAEDDFGPAELMLSLVSANAHIEDSLKLETADAKLSFQLQTLFSSLPETTRESKGFYTSFYIPFLNELQKKDDIMLACYIALSSNHSSENQEWQEDNSTKIEEFYEWLKTYQWLAK